MTEGQYRVGVSFNPSGNAKVDEIKRLTAQLIDLVLNHNGPGADEAVVAATRYEEAAMWAVKSVTKPPRPFPD